MTIAVNFINNTVFITRTHITKKTHQTTKIRLPN